MKRFLGRNDIIIGCLVLLVFVLYSNSFMNGFMYHDTEKITGNGFITQLVNIPQLFTSRYFQLTKESDYRPLTTITYFTDYRIWKGNVTGWRIVNMALLCLSAVLLFFITLGILKSRIFALIAAVLFIAHPVHSESVNCISFRAEFLSGTLMLSSLFLYIKYLKNKYGFMLVISALLFMLSLFARDTSIILLPVLMLYEGCFVKGELKSDAYKRYLVFLVLSLIYIAGRFIIHSPAAGLGELWRYQDANIINSVFTLFTTMMYYMKLMLFPLKLTIDYRWFPVVSSLRTISPWAAMTVVLLVVAGIFAVRTYSKRIYFSSMCFLIALVPISGIMPLRSLVAERYLFIPSFGFCVLLGVLFLRIYNNAKRYRYGKYIKAAVFLCVMLLLGFYCLRTYIRNYDWRSEVILFGRALLLHPTAYSYVKVGNVYAEKDDYKTAEVFYNKAIGFDPLFLPAYRNLGMMYYNKKDYDGAIYYLSKVIEIYQNDAEILTYLGRSYLKLGEKDKAMEYLEQAEVLSAKGMGGSKTEIVRSDIDVPSTAEEYCILGVQAYKNGETAKAMEYLKKGIELDGNSMQCYYNLGLFYGLQDDIDKGIMNLQKAAAIDPDFILAKYNLGVLYARKGAFNKAIIEFVEVLKHEPDNINALYYLGLSYKSKEDYVKAKDSFLKILQINPEHISAKEMYNEVKGK